MRHDLFGLARKGSDYKWRMLRIAVPIIIQFSIGISLNMVDSLMIGRLGVNPLAAVGAANEVWYVLNISVYGLCSGAAVYIAQYWGAGEVRQVHKVLGICYTCTGVFILTGTVLAFLFAPHLIRIFSREPEIIRLGTAYLRIVCLSYPITCIADVISFASRSIQKLAVTTAVSCAAILANIILNYALIYGKFGLPQMGVEGAALATVIAHILQFGSLFLYVYCSKDHPLAAKPRELLDFNRRDMASVLKVSLPVMVSEGGWSVANSLYYVAYGLIGPAAQAGAQVVVIVGKIVQSIFGGFSNASGILIGEEIGKGNAKEAQADGMIFVRIVGALGVIFTVFMFAVSGPVAAWYHFDGATTMMVTQGIQVFSGFIMLKMFGYLFVCGILRAGGDTRFCMFVDLGTSWLIAVPAVFIGVSVFHVGLPAAVACVYCSEVVKAGLCFWRFFGKKWIQVDVS